jgi:hypothetical protein
MHIHTLYVGGKWIFLTMVPLCVLVVIKGMPGIPIVDAFTYGNMMVVLGMNHFLLKGVLIIIVIHVDYLVMVKLFIMDM